MKKKAIRAVFATIGLGVIALSMFFVPPVKEFIDEKILDKPPIDETKDKMQLEKVKNISFDEKSRLLTFDRVENALVYEIQVRNLDIKYRREYSTPDNSIIIEFPFGSLSGHRIKFEIISRGDGEKFHDSTAAVYEYVLQYQTEVVYEEFTKDFFECFQGSINYHRAMGPIERINVIEIKNGNVHVRGTVFDKLNQKVNFELVYNTSEYPKLAKYVEADFDNLNELIELVYMLGSVRPSTVQQTIEYIQPNNFTEGLMQSNSILFQDYIARGYTIINLEQKHSSIYQLGNKKAFTVTGIYQAFNPETSEIETFELVQEIQMNEKAEFTEEQDYFNHFNQTGEGDVIENQFKLYDENMMHHLNIINKLYQKDNQMEHSQEQ